MFEKLSENNFIFIFMIKIKNVSPYEISIESNISRLRFFIKSIWQYLIWDDVWKFSKCKQHFNYVDFWLEIKWFFKDKSFKKHINCNFKKY